MDDHYKALGLEPGASADEIKKAYRALAREHHPDVKPDDPNAEARFKEISQAYATLSKRDDPLEPQAPTSQPSFADRLKKGVGSKVRKEKDQRRRFDEGLRESQRIKARGQPFERDYVWVSKAVDSPSIDELANEHGLAPQAVAYGQSIARNHNYDEKRAVDLARIVAGQSDLERMIEIGSIAQIVMDRPIGTVSGRVTKKEFEHIFAQLYGAFSMWVGDEKDYKKARDLLHESVHKVPQEKFTPSHVRGFAQLFEDLSQTGVGVETATNIVQTVYSTLYRMKISYGGAIPKDQARALRPVVEVVEERKKQGWSDEVVNTLLAAATAQRKHPFSELRFKSVRHFSEYMLMLSELEEPENLISLVGLSGALARVAIGADEAENAREEWIDALKESLPFYRHQRVAFVLAASVYQPLVEKVKTNRRHTRKSDAPLFPTIGAVSYTATALMPLLGERNYEHQIHRIREVVAGFEPSSYFHNTKARRESEDLTPEEKMIYTKFQEIKRRSTAKRRITRNDAEQLVELYKPLIRGA